MKKRKNDMSEPAAASEDYSASSLGGVDRVAETYSKEPGLVGDVSRAYLEARAQRRGARAQRRGARALLRRVLVEFNGGKFDSGTATFVEQVRGWLSETRWPADDEPCDPDVYLEDVAWNQCAGRCQVLDEVVSRLSAECGILYVRADDASAAVVRKLAKEFEAKRAGASAELDGFIERARARREKKR